MKNDELKKIMNDNRNDIAKASRLGLGIVLGAVILIGVIFYGIAPKTRKKEDTSSAPAAESAAEHEKTSDVPADREPPAEEERVVPAGHLYRVAADTGVFDRSGEYIGGAAEGEIFSSYDELDISEFGTGKQIEIEYYSQRGYLYADDLVEVMPAVVLPTAVDSLVRDEFSGISYPGNTADCGAIAAAALVNSQKLRKWDKADLISADQLLETNGDLVKLINTYSGGDLIAERISGDTESTLKERIDKGDRVLLAVRYYEGVTDFDYSDYYGITSDTQYVVVCGYTEDDEYGLSFYCCDPFYGQNGRSLATVSSQTLCTSAELVDDERRCMIILR